MTDKKEIMLDEETAGALVEDLAGSIKLAFAHSQGDDGFDPKAFDDSLRYEIENAINVAKAAQILLDNGFDEDSDPKKAKKCLEEHGFDCTTLGCKDVLDYIDDYDLDTK